MYIIAGLGNPTDKYEKTRHNVGFDTIDILAKDLGVTMGKSIFKALVGKTMIGSEKVLLIKPLTFMNLSGNAIRALTSSSELSTQVLNIPVKETLSGVKIIEVKVNNDTANTPVASPLGNANLVGISMKIKLIRERNAVRITFHRHTEKNNTKENIIYVKTRR